MFCRRMSPALLCALAFVLFVSFSNGKSIPKVIDLSYPYDNQTYYWPEKDKPVGFSIQTIFKGFADGKNVWYQAKEFCSREHGGTHIDAPNHFSEPNWSLSEIPIERLVNIPAVIIDIREKASKVVDATVDPDDVTKWESTNGEVPQGSVVIMYSGWGKYWGNLSAFIGDPGNDPSKLHFPGFGLEAAELLLKRGVFGVGVDTPSLDVGSSRTAPVHKVLSKENIYLLENVAYLDKLDLSTKYLLNMLPIKLAEGTGGPTRIVAFEASSGGTVVASFVVTMCLVALSTSWGSVFGQ